MRRLKNVVRAGASEALHSNRSELFEGMETSVRHASAAATERDSSQVNLFAVDGGREPARLRLKDRPDWPPMERLKEEFAALGFYLSAHPLDAYDESLDRLKVGRKSVGEGKRGAVSVYHGGRRPIKKKTK